MIEKSQIRKAIFHSAGCDADDWLDGAKRDSNGFEGAKKSLKKASKDLLAVVAVVKRDLDEGKLDGLEAAEVADYAILQVTRCRDALENASLHFENRQIASQGEIAAYEKVVDYFKKQYDREESKMRMVVEAIESGEITVEDDGEMVKQAGNGQITGVRPTMSVSAQRKAEAAAEESGEDSEEPQEAPEEKEEKVEAKEETPAEKPKKTRKRRRKKKDEDVDA